MHQPHTTQGFTIVELLIVIVVIGILASITIVAFNGVQDRARVVSVQSDLRNLHTSLQEYQAINGEYPATGTSSAWSWRYSCSLGITNFIPGVTTSNSPQAPCGNGATNNDTWLYGSDGTEYKLIHLRANFSNSAREAIPASFRDPVTGRWTATATAWGYWSAGAATTR